MPSPRANLLTRLHRRDLLTVSLLASRRMADFARTADVADIDSWWERNVRRALGIVLGAADATATLGVRYLRRHAATEGILLEPVRALPSREQIETSLRVAGPVAFKKHMTLTGDPQLSLQTMGTQLRGTGASRALDGDRSTFMATFVERPQLVGYRRVTSANPCYFCAALASRGAVYSKSTAGFQAHTPNCRCTAEPLYDHEDDPPDVVALRDQWNETTAGLSGRAALNAFRRARGG